MPTIAHRLPARTPQRLTMWVLGAVVVAVVAITLALAAVGSGGQQADRAADQAQPAPHEPTPLGGARP